MRYNYIDSLDSREIKNIFLKGMFSVIVVVLLFVLFYCLIPIGWYSTDLDAKFDITYENINNDNVEYIYSLSGLRLSVNNELIQPKLGFSGKYNSVRTIKIDNKYFVIYPVSWKEYSLSKLEDEMQNLGLNRQIKSNKSISIVEIRNSYQRIPLEEVEFYKTYMGINRLIYNNVDTFKIVTFSYRNEVIENELYWNNLDGYYYLICPGNAEVFFQYNDEYSHVDIV